MEKVIVTGASGFIGKALCKALLEKGVIIYALVRNASSVDDLKEYGEVRPIEIGLHEYMKLPEMLNDEIDVFYHLAWEGTYGIKLTDYELQLSNIKNSCDAMMAAIQLKCKKFILAGTINELEIKTYINMDICEPRLACIYGTSKLACEMMCKTLAYQNNMAFNTAIIGSVFGPGDKSKMIQNVLIKKFIEGEKPKLVQGEYLYDWIYIDDAAQLLGAIGEKSKNFKSYYIGHNELRLFKDIILEVRDIVNPNMKITFGEIKDSSIIDYLQIDINAVYEDTGCLPKSDFKENILKTVEWVKTLSF
jgi:nucleoside-diphosphate-sugar epimerase